MNVEDERSPGAERRSPARPGGGTLDPRVPPFVVAGRLLLLLIAAAALVAGVVHARWHDQAAGASKQLYVCPMHPEVRSSAPGDCPICHMALVPIRASDHGESGVPGGGPIVAIAEARMVARQVRAAAWVDAAGHGTALLYKDDLVGLEAEEPARFFAPQSPNMPLEAHVLTAEQAPVDSSTVNVSFRLDPPMTTAADAAGREDVGSLQIDVRARRLLVVPTSAVLYAARGPYVLAADDAAGGFSKRPVVVGRILDSGYVGALTGQQEGGATVILSGLREGEKVVAGHAFFADVERRLREASGDGEEAMR
jgi:hypothetical protein